MARPFRIEIAPTGFHSLKQIRDKKTRLEVLKAIDGLETFPETQGKALFQPLEGLRSVRAARSRYRVIYKVEPRLRRVSILLVGERKPGREEDIYAVAQKLLKILLRE